MSAGDRRPEPPAEVPVRATAERAPLPGTPARRRPAAEQTARRPATAARTSDPDAPAAAPSTARRAPAPRRAPTRSPTQARPAPAPPVVDAPRAPARLSRADAARLRREALGAEAVAGAVVDAADQRAAGLSQAARREAEQRAATAQAPVRFSTAPSPTRATATSTARQDARPDARSASADPTATDREPEGAEPRYASFPRRAASLGLDVALSAALLLPVEGVFLAVARQLDGRTNALRAALGVLVVTAIAQVFLQVDREAQRGATFGKALVRITLVDSAKGKRLRLRRVLVRRLLSGLLWFVSYPVALLGPSHRTLADRLLGTEVRPDPAARSVRRILLEPARLVVLVLAVGALLLTPVVDGALRPAPPVPTPVTGPVRALDLDDLDGRLLVPAGLDRQPDDGPGLGETTAADTAANLARSAVETGQLQKFFTDLGLQRGLGHAYSGELTGVQTRVTVSVVRFAAPDGADRLVSLIRTSNDGSLRSRTVPNAVTSASQQADGYLQEAVFSRGRFAYTLDVATADRVAQDEFDRLLKIFRDLVVRSDP